jgi:hypothetical protein
MIIKPTSIYYFFTFLALLFNFNICYSQIQRQPIEIPPNVDPIVRSAIENLYSDNALTRALAASDLGRMCDKAISAQPHLSAILDDDKIIDSKMIRGPAYFVLDVMNGYLSPSEHAALAISCLKKECNSTTAQHHSLYF